MTSEIYQIIIYPNNVSLLCASVDWTADDSFNPRWFSSGHEPNANAEGFSVLLKIYDFVSFLYFYNGGS